MIADDRPAEGFLGGGVDLIERELGGVAVVGAVLGGRSGEGDDLADGDLRRGRLGPCLRRHQRAEREGGAGGACLLDEIPSRNPDLARALFHVLPPVVSCMALGEP